MQLLVSVAGPAEARAALRGGADVIDAKDPRHGTLGPVPLHGLAAIGAAVNGGREAELAALELAACGGPERLAVSSSTAATPTAAAVARSP